MNSHGEGRDLTVPSLSPTILVGICSGLRNPHLQLNSNAPIGVAHATRMAQ